jgi:hypothetical protein
MTALIAPTCHMTSFLDHRFVFGGSIKKESNTRASFQKKQCNTSEFHLVFQNKNLPSPKVYWWRIGKSITRVWSSFQTSLELLFNVPWFQKIKREVLFQQGEEVLFGMSFLGFQIVISHPPTIPHSDISFGHVLFVCAGKKKVYLAFSLSSLARAHGHRQWITQSVCPCHEIE